jgi:hypothetical protein
MDYDTFPTLEVSQRMAFSRSQDLNEGYSLRQAKPLIIIIIIIIIVVTRLATLGVYIGSDIIDTSTHIP